MHYITLTGLISTGFAPAVLAAHLTTSTTADDTAIKLIESSHYQQCATNAKQCQQNIEVIEVTGQRPNPISVSSQGVYTLDRKMLRDYRFGNGNLNDVLGVLPGVQYGETAYAAEQISNIKPAEVSLAGTQGNATGYLIDGLSNNSNLNNGSANVDKNLLQDVSGHTQAVFLNLDLIDHLEVYDSNIPAKYGNFSGGMVKAETRKAGNQLQFGINYRQTSDDWVTYHKFYAPDFNGENELNNAIFNKRDFSSYLATPLTDKLGFIGQFQYMQSQESLQQLGQTRLQQQSNYNGLVKFDYAATANDDISLSLLFAPYEGDYFDVNAKNSDYSIAGGGNNLSLTWQADRNWAYIKTQLGYNTSRNSKNTSSIRYAWLNIPGKDWGDIDGSITSLEGGYGDIEKRQQTVSLKQDFELASRPWLDADNTFSFGYELAQHNATFDRLEDAIVYNGAIAAPQIECAGYALDCIETQLYQSVAELEAQLGHSLDLSNPDDFLIYQNNFAVTGQYFQYRQVTPKATTHAELNQLAAYVENEFAWQNYTLNLGIRYDYNDFLNNHNLAPRMRGSVSVFAEQGKIVLGANRYYANDSMSYKLNQAMQPSYTEVRATYQQQPQQWQAQLSNRGYRYVYTDLKTPYSDELSAAYRHQLLGGTLELKWLYREQHDAINRVKSTNEAGEAILLGANSGHSRYQRYSLSWMATYANQHVEFNLSHASNTTSREQFDGDPRSFDGNGDSVLDFSYDDNELVFLRADHYDIASSTNNANYYLVTRHDMALEKQDFNRPIIANLSWGGQWDNWTLSAHARYNGGQDAIYATGKTKSLKEASNICDGCAPNRREYPVYRIEKRPAFWLLNSSVKYTTLVANDYQLTLSFEAENLLNKRTYQISPYNTGIELGRRFWLGANINY
ncbi:TonB-dependent receptor plug domain-containing protein [Pseudoalteromonas sp.]|uniref:TonB-dependent receptor plug domain-containing protein n=1 Tax=Pseudoalteromonas sp. TaxID=53249 RepID=UPI003561D6DA